jgi:hypothetical protein
VGSAEYRSLEVAENLKRSGEAAATSGRFSRRRMPCSLGAAIDPPALGLSPRLRGEVRSAYDWLALDKAQ